MSYNPDIHHRRSIRLKGYDYARAGLYFITICAQNRECLFGSIADGKMVLNAAGKMVEREWQNLKTRFPQIELHEYVVMPDHFHGILEIAEAPLLNEQPQGEGQPQGAAPTADAQFEEEAQIPEIVRAALVAAQQDAAIFAAEPPQGTLPARKILGDMMDAFKSITTVEYIRGVKNWGWKRFNGKLWQRNYYEHVIRNERAYRNIAHYILNNPAQWR